MAAGTAVEPVGATPKWAGPTEVELTEAEAAGSGETNGSRAVCNAPSPSRWIPIVGGREVGGSTLEPMAAEPVEAPTGVEPTMAESMQAEPTEMESEVEPAEAESTEVVPMAARTAVEPVGATPKWAGPTEVELTEAEAAGSGETNGSGAVCDAPSPSRWIPIVCGREVGGSTLEMPMAAPPLPWQPGVAGGREEVAPRLAVGGWTEVDVRDTT